jgi:hypothetical protein
MPASNEPLTLQGEGARARYATSKHKPSDQLGLPLGHIRAFKVGQRGPPLRLGQLWPGVEQGGTFEPGGLALASQVC